MNEFAVRSIVFLASYVFVAAVHLFRQWRELTRAADKRERYAQLPLGYKLACVLVVIPLIAAGVASWVPRPNASVAVTGPLAFGAYIAIEAACVRWYKRHKLL